MPPASRGCAPIPSAAEAWRFHCRQGQGRLPGCDGGVGGGGGRAGLWRKQHPPRCRRLDGVQVASRIPRRRMIHERSRRNSKHEREIVVVAGRTLLQYM